MATGSPTGTCGSGLVGSSRAGFTRRSDTGSDHLVDQANRNRSKRRTHRYDARRSPTGLTFAAGLAARPRSRAESLLANWPI